MNSMAQLEIVRKYAPIRWCALNRECKIGLVHCWHERALELTKPASLKSVSMETTTVVVHESMIGSHHC